VMNSAVTRTNSAVTNEPVAGEVLSRERLEELVGQVVGDAAALQEPDADPQLEALRIAVLLEDVFGIVLADDDIGAALTADPAAVVRLVTGRAGRAGVR
jgi:hypothetical protein